MDAIKLFNEWKNNVETKLLTEVVEAPTSLGGFDILGVSSILQLIYIKIIAVKLSLRRTTMLLELRFPRYRVFTQPIQI